MKWLRTRRGAAKKSAGLRTRLTAARRAEKPQIELGQGTRANTAPTSSNKAAAPPAAPSALTPAPPAAVDAPSALKSSLQQQFAKKLEGARFRALNEELYTSRSADAFQSFQREPDKFLQYHRGYREQAAQWPVNPLDVLIDWINSQHKQAVIADMGCGEARLAASVANTVHSFDLVAGNARVTACDMAHVPLPSEAVDIVIFCLSLMGTNLVDFIKEARRILRTGGILKIVEVRSRFHDQKGIDNFKTFLQNAKFQVSERASSKLQNKMFFDLECIKLSGHAVLDPKFSLKSCQYKRR